MSSKVTSAGFVVYHDGKYLIGHPTSGTGTTHGWGILKGKVDEGESILQGALREFYEESGYKIVNAKSISISAEPIFEYKVKKKTVKVFFLNDHLGEIYNAQLKCLSMIDDSQVPEIASYKWATKDEIVDLVVQSQKPLFEYVLKDHNRLIQITQPPRTSCGGSQGCNSPAQG